LAHIAPPSAPGAFYAACEHVHKGLRQPPLLVHEVAARRLEPPSPSDKRKERRRPIANRADRQREREAVREAGVMNDQMMIPMILGWWLVVALVLLLPVGLAIAIVVALRGVARRLVQRRPPADGGASGDPPSSGPP